jgi:hypothetical protein
MTLDTRLLKRLNVIRRRLNVMYLGWGRGIIKEDPKGQQFPKNPKP